ncbi:glycosyltransferase family 2 protein [Lamprobacter modestohalophilus]|uniref:Glycosyl transferase n=1 Tax=Lamprobacter modestohalophilus TaxID=1064514 RepID=A0A9X0WEP4_9GAMM|nr:glycosyltransferase family 2 protein [Lamprobacter modestohalophilus]MBK1621830.1 glycosyl transferase [Lamprobacter modestohalophilus]MEA1049031.1 glycosyltransferase family 2 protein [Lamprobacter modestohalophilus]
MKISVITTLCNAVQTIDDCLDAMAAQSHADREHLVIDGDSTDGTLERLQRRRDQLGVLVSEPDGGIYFGLNKGLALATGEVIGILHSDDLYADTEVLARVARAFADPAVQALYGDLVYVAADDTRRVIRHWRAGAFRPQRLRWGWMPPHPTLFLRRSVYERVGVFDTGYRIAADYDLMLRVLSQLEGPLEGPGDGQGDRHEQGPEHRQGRVVYVPEVLVRMRLGGKSNRNLKQIAQKSWEDYQILRRQGLGGPPGTGPLGALSALAWKNLSKLPQFVRR